MHIRLTGIPLNMYAFARPINFKPNTTNGFYEANAKFFCEYYACFLYQNEETLGEYKDQRPEML